MGLRVSARLAALLRCTWLSSEMTHNLPKHHAHEVICPLIPSALCQLVSQIGGPQYLSVLQSA